MPNPVRTALLTLLLLVAVGGGIYAYGTRAGKAPNQLPSTSPRNSNDTLQLQANEQLFRLSKTTSQTEYRLGEVLRGEPVTVVGATREVEGALAINRSNLPASRLGTIRVNARTFKTDSDRRDNAVQRMILKSEQDAFEYIDFLVKNLQAPTTASNGQPFNVEILGDLTIAGVSREATFQGTAQFSNDNELIGDVETTVTYSDYGISVPNLPFLANVDKNATLRFHFVAIR